MIVDARVAINGSVAATWAALTNMENAAAIITGIEKIEMVQKPPAGLVGLRWKETRMLFGEAATVEKWITDAEENKLFKTRAESDGYVFLTTTTIAQDGNRVVVTSAHETKPQSFAARVKSLPMFLFKGMIRKAILKDLNDIKSAVERADR